MSSINNSRVVPALSKEAQLKRKVRSHLSDLGFVRDTEGLLSPPEANKTTIRTMHAHQRREKLRSNSKFIRENWDLFKGAVADGNEIEPEKIDLTLRQIKTGSDAGILFRMASLSWSVPVSNGFGRRLRFLIWDRYHDRLAGVAALGDPVFNLSVRDQEIGWSGTERGERLCNVLDAYVLGALPPYNLLLGGKAIACMLRSRDTFDVFSAKYGSKPGLISGRFKSPKLLAITTSSSMGRSSLYNRLSLERDQYLRPIGYSKGWGHFHIPDDLFVELRQYLEAIGHPYSRQYEYGEGSNWRLRAIKAAFHELGLQQNLLHHGIKRQVFIGYLAQNAKTILQSGVGEPNLSKLRTASDICDLAKERWIVPRSKRHPEFRLWKKNNVMKQLREDYKPIFIEGQVRDAD